MSSNKSFSPVSPLPVINTTGICLLSIFANIGKTRLSILVELSSVKVPSISKQTALYFCLKASL